MRVAADGLRASASDCDGCKVGIGIEAGIRAPWFSDIRPARASEDGFRCGNHEVVCRAVPDAAKIVVQPETVDRNAGPHSMANDGRLVRSLEERYPDLKKIGFAL